jgi:hypothetical protein
LTSKERVEEEKGGVVKDTEGVVLGEREMETRG